MVAAFILLAVGAVLLVVAAFQSTTGAIAAWGAAGAVLCLAGVLVNELTKPR